MTTELHPSQLHHLLKTQVSATVATWGLIGVAATMLSVGIAARPPVLRSVLFSSGLLAVAVARPIRNIAIANERLSNDAADLSHTAWQQWLLDAMKPAAPPALVQFGAATIEPSPMANLEDVKNHKHTLIVGPTNSGKSTVATYLAGMMQGEVKVIDPHASPYDWQGLKVIGAGRDYAAIADEMSDNLEEMDRRYKLRAEGQKSFPELVLIVDEYPAISASGECRKLAPVWLKKLTREARKVSIKLIILTQGAEVAALGLEGEGTVRDAFGVLRLGKLATAHAKSLKDDALLQQVKALRRPAMLDDLPVSIPELATAIAPIFPSEFGSVWDVQPVQKLNLEPGKSEPLNPPVDNGSRIPERSEPKFTPDGLTQAEAIDRISELKQVKMNQEQIILSLWRCKKGGSRAYQEALQQYKQLTGEL